MRALLLDRSSWLASWSRSICRPPFRPGMAPWQDPNSAKSSEIELMRVCLQPSSAGAIPQKWHLPDRGYRYHPCTTAACTMPPIEGSPLAQPEPRPSLLAWAVRGTDLSPVTAFPALDEAASFTGIWTLGTLAAAFLVAVLAQVLLGAYLTERGNFSDEAAHFMNGLLI